MAEEKQFEQKVKSYIESVGGWQVKFFANRMTKQGIPDILACINGFFLGIEIKAQRGKISPLQKIVCMKIRESGGYAFVLYPSGFEQFKTFVKAIKSGKQMEVPDVFK